MLNFSRNVLDQNITKAVLGQSREEIVSQFKLTASNVRGEFYDVAKDPVSLIRKDIYTKISNHELIKRLRHISKHQIFEKWIDISYVENKNTEIINKILDGWNKKQSAQRRDLGLLFKFLKAQDISTDYKRVIEANRSSKYVTYEELRFMYNHPSIEISDSMGYILTRNEYYFYKNFEMLLILSSSFQKHEGIKNNEISNMRNVTGSLYYKLLTYSKNVNKIIKCVKSNSISNTNGRFKHSLILEELKGESKDVQEIDSYVVLSLTKTKEILENLESTLEKINCILNINVQKEINYFTLIKTCLITQQKAVLI